MFLHKQNQVAKAPPAPRLPHRNFDGEARDRLIVWIRRRMDEYGISAEDLAAAIEADKPLTPRYRDHKGNEWNGEGDMPDWLKRVQQLGVDADFFAVRQQDATPGVCSPGDAEMPIFFGAR
ncbi:DNA-binding protein H-NS [Paraburkholderia sp. GAS33]|jgi:DNA-binding protein H-NS|uniref:H-NS family nucleoid-associated regulatory protein n=1 Tax=Paraburkholderia fungorum TaxID=134537 RepID=UPI000DB4C3C1|nr:H-NS family nucleoid-associated regulatory protein [Paraburkholderia fungorum]PZR42139.1 MAG: histone family protein nucleoid-structuring protein H-NS [Paraburkholderia fungorum]